MPTPRTSAPSVISCLAPGKDYDTLRNPDLTFFITSANLIVTWCIQNAARFGRLGMDDSSGGLATQVETALAAGLYKLSDQQYKSKSTGGASGSTRGGDGTKTSQQNQYLRMACAIDSSKVLRPYLDNDFSVTAWLGKQVADQIPYSERETE